MVAGFHAGVFVNYFSLQLLHLEYGSPNSC